jgi:hypothetical protein
MSWAEDMMRWSGRSVSSSDVLKSPKMLVISHFFGASIFSVSLISSDRPLLLWDCYYVALPISRTTILITGS